MKKTFTPVKWPCLVAVISICVFLSEALHAQVVLTRDMSNYIQDFNTLPISGSDIWVNGNFYIPGWTVNRTSTTTSLLTGTGSSNAGGLYSFGLSGANDRALGAISSGTAAVGQFAWGLLLQNKTGTTITSLHVSFTGEQWRSASRSAGRQATTFWYSHNEEPDFDLSPLRDNNWINVPELDFYSLVNFSPAGALNGNLPDHKSYLIATIPVYIPEGHFIMLRWKDLNDLDDDHGLAIDDFYLTWGSGVYTGPIVMPVELIFFKSSLVANGVKLDWATASERNSSHFNVERSTNGLLFETIGSVPAKGNSSIKNSYSFLDELPIIGTSYYRLKQVDQDDTYEFSKGVSVTKKGPVSLSAYPSVTKGEIHFNLPISSTGTPLQVYDKMGRLVLAEIIPGKEISHKVNLAPLKPGNYFVVLLDEKGQRQVFRVTKI